MSTVEPVRMFDSEPHSFELTEIDAPEEELLSRYLPIGDVAKSIGVNPSVLRFWEQEFPQLRPTKRGNRRYYSAEDVALIRTIQHLLYEEHYTILGARNKIHELRVQDKVKDFMEEDAAAPMVAVAPQKPAVDLGAVLKELKAIRQILTEAPSAKEKERLEKEARDEANRQAVENFSLVAQDYHAMLADELAQKKNAPEPEVKEAPQVAPLSYDLGALGAEDTDFLTPSPLIGTMSVKASEKSEPKAAVAEPVVETIAEPVAVQPAPEPKPQPAPVTVQPKPDEPVAAALKPQQTKRVESTLPVPPLPHQQQGFTIGMKVTSQMKKSGLIHTSPTFWKK